MQENHPIAQFEIGDFKNFVYLILDWETREAAIVDPQADLREPLETLRENRFNLTQVLLTHSHFDHIAGLGELVQMNPDLLVRVHEQEVRRIRDDIRVKAKIVKCSDNEIIPVGSLRVRVLHTPGHSAGECCFLIESTRPPYLLTGDTVFIRDCGRTDMETGSNRSMFESIQRIKKLDPETVILPGHHYARELSSTLGKELKESPPFQCKSVEELELLP